MSNKQTAVEWLMENIDINFIPETNTISMKGNIWEKALAMERKEHERIADKAREDGWKDAKYGSQRW